MVDICLKSDFDWLQCMVESSMQSYYYLYGIYNILFTIRDIVEANYSVYWSEKTFQTEAFNSVKYLNNSRPPWTTLIQVM